MTGSRQTPQGSRATRRREFSQNFLRAPAAIETFMAALPPADGRPAIEVGAGDGALTLALAAHFGELTAWELDTAMARRLSRRVAADPSVRIEVGDFLRSPSPGEPFHLAGNVPFGITTKIVNWCLDAETLASATVITQLEYARKRTGDYGRWSLTTVTSWPAFDWVLAGRISRRSFEPAPAVDAGVVSIWRRTEPLIPDFVLPRWREVVELGFGGVGGSLYASLRATYPARALSRAFTAAQVDRAMVVAFVHPDQWIDIFTSLERG